MIAFTGTTFSYARGSVGADRSLAVSSTDDTIKLLSAFASNVAVLVAFQTLEHSGSCLKGFYPKSEGAYVDVASLLETGRHEWRDVSPFNLKGRCRGELRRLEYFLSPEGLAYDFRGGGVCLQKGAIERLDGDLITLQIRGEP